MDNDNLKRVMEDYLYYYNCGRTEAECFLYYPPEREEDKQSYHDGIESYLKETNYPLTLEEYIKSCMVNSQK